MKLKSKSLKKNILGICVLSAMLIGVFYAMQYTRSLNFQSSLEILFNPQAEKTWAWCPKETQSLELTQPNSASELDMTQVCTIEVAPAPEIPEDSYKPLLKAIGTERSITLESDSKLEIFRIEGLPFKSPRLSDYLKAQKAGL